MASLASIRTAVKTTLEAAITGLRVYDKIAAAVQVPSVVVEPDTADFLVAMGKGTDTWEFDLHVIVADSDEIVGQAKLDEYVTGAGTKSVRSAIFATPALGLTNTNAHVAGMTAYGVRFEQAPIQHIGATLRLIVHTKGSE
jgi:hypothetical protein